MTDIQTMREKIERLQADNERLRGIALRRANRVPTLTSLSEYSPENHVLASDIPEILADTAGINKASKAFAHTFIKMFSLEPTAQNKEAASKGRGRLLYSREEVAKAAEHLKSFSS